MARISSIVNIKLKKPSKTIRVIYTFLQITIVLFAYFYLTETGSGFAFCLLILAVFITIILELNKRGIPNAYKRTKAEEELGRDMTDIEWDEYQRKQPPKELFDFYNKDIENKNYKKPQPEKTKEYSVICKYCKVEVILDEEEFRNKSYTCPSCNTLNESTDVETKHEYNKRISREYKAYIKEINQRDKTISEELKIRIKEFEKSGKKIKTDNKPLFRFLALVSFLSGIYFSALLESEWIFLLGIMLSMYFGSGKGVPGYRARDERKFWLGKDEIDYAQDFEANNRINKQGFWKNLWDSYRY